MAFLHMSSKEVYFQREWNVGMLKGVEGVWLEHWFEGWGCGWSTGLKVGGVVRTLV